MSAEEKEEMQGLLIQLETAATTYELKHIIRKIIIILGGEPE